MILTILIWNWFFFHPFEKTPSCRELSLKDVIWPKSIRTNFYPSMMTNFSCTSQMHGNLHKNGLSCCATMNTNKKTNKMLSSSLHVYITFVTNCLHKTDPFFFVIKRSRETKDSLYLNYAIKFFAKQNSIDFLSLQTRSEISQLLSVINAT